MSLQKAVEDNNIQRVIVAPTELQSHAFRTDSQEYESKRLWIIKGDFEISIDKDTMENVLHCVQLDEGINITIPRPTVQGEEVPSNEDQLEAFIKMPVSAIVFHRKTLAMTGRECLRSEVSAFADACLESLNKAHPEDPQTLEDLAVVEIDFTNKHVEIRAIAPKE